MIIILLTGHPAYDILKAEQFPENRACGNTPASQALIDKNKILT